MDLSKTRFLYINEFEFKQEFEVKHCVGSTVITKEYINKLIVSDNIEQYQVFSFGTGVLLIFDFSGNVYSIVPSSGLIDVVAFLTILSKKHSKGDRTLYNTWEFYRVTENDNDYGVNILFDAETITLWYEQQKVTFNEKEFINGLLAFSNEIITWYENKYPLFRNSPIRKEILDLKEKVYQLYGDSDFLTTTNT